ncbi:MAG TPA: Maf family protein [Steroidobacteraceae bacterium]|nr:Maf family protein [Steroidobacteraceae bacterium]
MNSPLTSGPVRSLILASTSRYRAELLQRLGLPFAIESPGVPEDEVRGEPPPERALRLAQEKAAAVAARHPEAVVIGSDQVAAANTTILQKPGNAANCAEQLKLLSGSSAEFYTGCSLQCRATSLSLQHVDTTAIVMRALSDAEIERYVAREQPFDCAGGFKAEGLGITLFERIESEDPTALIGMPLLWLSGALRSAGYLAP